MIKEIKRFMGEYDLRKIKSWNSREGLGTSAEIYKNGVKIGDVLDEGNGDMVDVYINDKNEDKLLNEYATDKMKSSFEASGMFLMQVADYLDMVKKFKKQCVKSVLLHEKESALDEYGVPKTYYTIKVELNEDVKVKLLKKYPDAIIINEELSQFSLTEKPKTKKLKV